jgi:serine/threonine protein kinase
MAGHHNGFSYSVVESSEIMALVAGNRLGPYEITAPIGAGGMGEVYRAKDTTLKREVALKVLPEAFAADLERMARFQREAEVLASLNHPNIAQIYGVEDRALVMELVEGESPKGPMPFEEAWKIALQIAAGLEYAHEKGVVHRDLKPANVKVTADGVVKLLDFGLAKAFTGQTAASGNPENSPTLTLGATQLGVILGTAAYMAPEQAKGKTVDKRADIWSFGVVLYELLTGERIFYGEEAADTLAAVIHKDPNLSAVPEQARGLLRRCLEKDPKRRLRDIGEAQYLIDDRLFRTGERSRSRREWISWCITAALVAVAAGVSLMHFREAHPDSPVVKFQVPPPDKAAFGVFRLSPDGRYLAFIGTESGRRRLWVRALDSLEARVFPATDFANFPFWSPDSKSIGFASSDGKLKKIAVSGGPPQTLCDASTITRATWSRDDVIVFAQAPFNPLRRVSAYGGVPVPLTKLRPGESHFVPEFLPGGRRFLYLITGGKPENNGIHVGSLDNEPDIRLLPDESHAIFASTPASAGGGYLLFHRENTLFAQPFNPASIRFTGDVFPVADQIGTDARALNENYSASSTGVLAYGTTSTGSYQQLVWMDRSGKELGPVGPPGEYLNIRLSTDEKSIAFGRRESSNRDVWVLDLVRNVASRITYDPEVSTAPIWSPDGLQVLFPSRRSGTFDLYVKAATGAGEEQLLVKMGSPRGWADDWSRDGRFVLYEIPPSAMAGGQKTGSDLWIAPLFGDRRPYRYLQTQFDERDGVFSPDGHWIAYVSNESGPSDIYVQAFPLSKQKKRISINGGTGPLWRRDGGELFYIAADRTLMSVSVKMVGTSVEPGEPKRLFQVGALGTRRGSYAGSYAVSGDGRRFLISRPMADSSDAPVTLVLNWRAPEKK